MCRWRECLRERVFFIQKKKEKTLENAGRSRDKRHEQIVSYIILRWDADWPFIMSREKKKEHGKTMDFFPSLVRQT